MYSKTHTHAIVLGHYDAGEASRVYRLFTRDLGTVFARAQSSRLLGSKHRYGLQTLSVAEVSLVRSRGGWRLTNVVPQVSLHALHKDARAKHALTCRILALVRRFVIGEEEGGELFGILWNGLHFFEKHALSSEHARWFEALLVLRILNTLGYVQRNAVYTPFVESPSLFSQEHIEQFAPAYTTAVQEINRAIIASHL